MKFIKRTLSIIFLIWCLLVFVGMMLLILPFVLIFNWIFKGKKAQDLSFTCLQIWARTVVTLGFFSYQIKNKHYRDSKRAYIFVCNHNSYLDSVASVLAPTQSFKPLGKIEMSKVPIFGLIYSKLVVLINRSSAESRAKSVAELKVELATGQSILIFPEGTMNRTEAVLADFYDGAFRIAIETQTPIAPMVIINARNLLPRNQPLQARPGKLTVVFGEPVVVTDLSLDDVPELKNRVKQQMGDLILANS